MQRERGLLKGGQFLRSERSFLFRFVLRYRHGSPRIRCYDGAGDGIIPRHRDHLPRPDALIRRYGGRDGLYGASCDIHGDVAHLTVTDEVDDMGEGIAVGAYRLRPDILRAQIQPVLDQFPYGLLRLHDPCRYFRFKDAFLFLCLTQGRAIDGLVSSWLTRLVDADFQLISSVIPFLWHGIPFPLRLRFSH